MNNLTFKVQLTPTQSKRFQNEVLDKGGSWAEGQTTVILTTNPFMVLRQGKMRASSEHNERYFRNAVAPEVLTEQAFKLVKNALPIEKPIRGGADKPTNPEEEFHSGLATLIKNLDEMYETILEKGSKWKREGK